MIAIAPGCWKGLRRAEECRITREAAQDINYHDSQIVQLYNIANPPGPDTDFYVSLAGSTPSTVLDLGCGTGTLCCALAASGHQVTGVDPAAAMLAIARSKPNARFVEWVESSAQTYASSRPFDLIVMTGHAFQVLLTDEDTLAVLTTMRYHLGERGKIVFESRNPTLDWAEQWAGRVRKLPGGILETLEIIANNGEFISFETIYQFADKELRTRSTLRFPSAEHVQELISRSGLKVRQILGDWDSNPLEITRSPEMIFFVEHPGRNQTDSTTR